MKAFTMASLLLLKYKLNQEFRQTSTIVNQWISSKLYTVTIFHGFYLKLSTVIYQFANKGLQSQ
jgi:hypothetical protein